MGNAEHHPKWTLRIFDINISDSFKYPLEIINTDDELIEFLSQTELEIDDYEKSRFLSVGDVIQIQGETYKVDQVYLKLYDQSLSKYTATQIHIVVGVEKN